MSCAGSYSGVSSFRAVLAMVLRAAMIFSALVLVSFCSGSTSPASRARALSWPFRSLSRELTCCVTYRLRALSSSGSALTSTRNNAVSACANPARIAALVLAKPSSVAVLSPLSLPLGDMQSVWRIPAAKSASMCSPRFLSPSVVAVENACTDLSSFVFMFYISSFSGSRYACLLVTYYPYLTDNVKRWSIMVDDGMLGTSLTMDLALTPPTPDPPSLLWDSTHLLVL